MSGRRRRVVVAVVLALGVLGLAGGAWWVLQPRKASSAAAAAAPPATTTVSRQDLVSARTVTATLAYGAERGIEARLRGTLTGVPAVGATVRRGKALYRVDDRPVILLYGSLPAFRNLTAGGGSPAGEDVGADRSAAATPDGGEARTDDRDNGKPDKGKPDNERPGNESGDAADPATAAGRRAKPGGPTTAPTSSAVKAGRSRGADVRQFEANLQALGYRGFTVDDEYTPATATAVRRWQRDLGLPQTGVVELGRVVYAAGALRVAEHKLAVGQELTGTVLTCTDPARVVVAALPKDDEQLAEAGQSATVVLPDSKEVPATIKSVSSAPAGEERDAGTGEKEVQVRLAPGKAIAPAASDSPLQVRFSGERRDGVLAVPVNALLALAEGGFGLEVVQGGKSRVVPVTTGLFAQGQVEVSGSEVVEGMTVGTSQ